MKKREVIKKILSFVLIICMIIPLYVNNIAYADADYEAWSTLNGVSTDIYVKEKNGDVQWVAYCFKVLKDYPAYSDTETTPFINKIPGTYENLKKHAENKKIDTDKVLSVLYNGYPFDSSGIKAKHGVTDDVFRKATQYAVWVNSDGIDLKDLNSTERKVAMDILNGPAAPKSFTASIYIPKPGEVGSYNKPIQELLVADAAIQKIPTFSVGFVKQHRINDVDFNNPTIAGGKFKITSGTVDGEVVHQWENDGTRHEVSGLKPGVYHFVEVEAPDGYKAFEINGVPQKSTQFRITRSGVLEIYYNKKWTKQSEFKGLDPNTVWLWNTPIPGYHDVVFSKLNIAGYEIPGAEIEIKSADNSTVIKSWTSGNVPKTIKLKNGKYIFHEKTAPNGYKTVSDISFEVSRGVIKILDKGRNDDNLVSSNGNRLNVVDLEKPEFKAGTLKTTVSVDNKTATEHRPVKLTADEVAIAKEIVDKVDYTDLVVGEEYKLTGTLMEVSESGDATAVQGVNPVSKTFTPKKANGTETITFKGVKLEPNKKYVVFEKAESVKEIDFKDGNPRKHTIDHSKADDKAQTIVVEKVKPEFKVGTLKTTVSVDNKTATENEPVKLTADDVAENKKVVDRVDYTDLVVNEEYQLTGTLMVIENGKAVPVKGVDAVVQKFTPSSPNGTETITFNNVKLEPDKKYVVFEKAESVKEIDFKDGNSRKHIIEHFKADDKAQTIVVEKEKPIYQKGNLRTTVSIDGNEATSAKPLTLTAIQAGQAKNVVDKVHYSGLIVGKTYKLTGTLMEVLPNGNAIPVLNVAPVEKEFTPQSDNGVEEITFTNVRLEPAKKYVVYEYAETLEEIDFKDVLKKHTAEHKDPEDNAQTVVVEKELPTYKDGTLRTTVSVDGKTATAAEPVKLTSEEVKTPKRVVDKVDYEGLMAGKEYKLTGTLMVVENGNAIPVDGVNPVTKNFTPDNSNGSEEIVFENVTLEAGKTYVVYEEAESVDTFVFKEGPKKHKAEHKNPDDKAQTVVVEKEKPSYKDGVLRTTVSIDNKKATEQEPVKLTAEEAKAPKKVVDRVDYEGLMAGKEYKFTGTLMVVENGNATPVKGVNPVVKKFVPKEVNGFEELEFENVTLEAGKTYVVYEEAESVESFEFKEGPKKHTAEHKDPKDKAQTIIVEKEAPQKPEFKEGKLRTTVKVGDRIASSTQEVVLGANEANPVPEIIDVIEYEGLFVGRLYKVKATIVEVLPDGSTKELEGHDSSELYFTPDKENGTQQISFTNVKLEAGKKYVVFEEAETVKPIEFNDGTTRKHTAEHKDPKDKAQTIIVEKEAPQKPEYKDGKLRTTVSVDGKVATEKEALKLTAKEVKTPKNVVDKIDYEGLMIGKEYKLTGTLMVIENGKAIPVKGVAPVTKNFTPQQADGFEEVVFENVTLEAGKTYVVYEEAESVEEFEFSDGTKKHRAEHKDPKDKAQTIIVENEVPQKPEYKDGKLRTTVSVDGREATKDDELLLNADEVLAPKDVVDKVMYEGLMVGKEYKLTGTLMEVLDDGSTKPVINVAPVEKKFISKDESGIEEITFKNVKLEAGKKYVVYEEAESVEEFEFSDGTTRKHEAEHKDPKDKAQTIVVEVVNPPKPQYKDGELKTTVSVDGKVATEKESVKLTAKEVKTPKNVVDKIDYKGLVAGKEYKLTGTLMVIENGKAIPVQGVAPVTKNFTPKQSNGVEEITFENVTLEAGKTYVVYEEAESVEEFEFSDGTKKHRAEHKDPNDKAQTVVVENEAPQKPEYKDGTLRTTVSVDNKIATTKDPVKLTAEEAKTPKNVVDRIDYKGLMVGKEYKLTGTLMVIENGKATPVQGVAPVVKNFVPQQADGVEEITFENVTLEAGKTYVVYEEAESVEEFEFSDGTKKHRAEHKDPNDKSQTVVVENELPQKPEYKDGKLKTTVGVDNRVANETEELVLTGMEVNELKTVVDWVEYSDLMIGKEYKLTGTLMEVSEDGSVKVVDGVAPVEKIFTPQNSSGLVQIVFENVKLEPNKKYVVFEEAETLEEIEFSDGTTRKHIVEHKDSNDKAQTIIVGSDYKKIIFSKRSSLNIGKELPGAEIVIRNEDGTVAKIYDKNMNLIEGGTWISGETEMEIFIEPGTYIFHEEVAPYGHLKVTEVKFKIDSDGNVFVLDLGKNDRGNIILKGNKIVVIDEVIPYIPPRDGEKEKPKDNNKNGKLKKTGHGISSTVFSGMVSTIGLAYLTLKKKKRNSR